MIVYGRRKTGKTFMLRRCVDWDVYVTVTRSLTCIVEIGGEVRFQDIGTCIDGVSKALSKGGTVVIDEFQRLPEDYWDLMGLWRHRFSGQLILCGSSLGVVGKVFDERSPLLGLLEPFFVDVASPEDTISSLARYLDTRGAVLWSPLARDPWILGITDVGGEPWDAVAKSAHGLVPVAVSLIGEVFSDEDRRLTRLYDAVLRLLAQHYWSSKTLAQKLFEARLISSPQPGIVTGVLSRLMGMGLVEKIPLWRTRGAKYYYKHRSPLLSVLLGIGELVEEHGARPNTQTLIKDVATELQFTLGELLAQHYKLTRAYTIMPHGEGDLDIVLLSPSKKPIIAYEVKLGAISRSEARKIAYKARAYGIPRIGLISLTERPPKEVADEVLGPEDILSIAKRLKKSGLSRSSPFSTHR